MDYWEESIENGKAIKITPDKERAISLINSSLKILKIIEKMKLEKENGFFILTNYYDVVLESMHALLYREGFKVLDHLSIGYYIKDVLKNVEFFNVFDKYRKIRNGILYYGREIDFETLGEFPVGIDVFFAI